MFLVVLIIIYYFNYVLALKRQHVTDIVDERDFSYQFFYLSKQLGHILDIHIKR